MTDSKRSNMRMTTYVIRDPAFCMHLTTYNALNTSTDMSESPDNRSTSRDANVIALFSNTIIGNTNVNSWRKRAVDGANAWINNAQRRLNGDDSKLISQLENQPRVVLKLFIFIKKMPSVVVKSGQMTTKLNGTGNAHRDAIPM